MIKKTVKLIDLDRNKEDTFDDPGSYLKTFNFKKAKTILINKGKTFGIFSNADKFGTIYAIQYDNKKRPLFLTYGWEDAVACLDSLYEIQDSLKELESVLMFTYENKKNKKIARKKY